MKSLSLRMRNLAVQSAESGPEPNHEQLRSFFAPPCVQQPAPLLSAPATVSPQSPQLACQLAPDSPTKPSIAREPSKKRRKVKKTAKVNNFELPDQAKQWLDQWMDLVLFLFRVLVNQLWIEQDVSVSGNGGRHQVHALGIWSGQRIGVDSCGYFFCASWSSLSLSDEGHGALFGRSSAEDGHGRSACC